MTDISFNIAFNKQKISQIVLLNQLFQFLNLVGIFGHSFFVLSRTLMRKNVNNDVSKDSSLVMRRRTILMVKITRGPAEQRLNLNSTSETTFLKKKPKSLFQHGKNSSGFFLVQYTKNIQSKRVKNALSSLWYTNNISDISFDSFLAIAEVFNNEGNEAYSKEDNSNALYFHTEGIKVNCKDEEPLAELYGNRAEKTTFKCSKFTGILKCVCLRLSRQGYSRLSINGHLYKTDT